MLTNCAVDVDDDIIRPCCLATLVCVVNLSNNVSESSSTYKLSNHLIDKYVVRRQRNFEEVTSFFVLAK